MEPNIAALADKIWDELAEASHVEHPIQIKAYYDDTGLKEDPYNNNNLVDFKKPSEIMVEEYQLIPAKSKWSSNVKYCLHSMNKFSLDEPIRLCHLLIVTAFWLKIFLMMPLARCQSGANWVLASFIRWRRMHFFPHSGARTRIPDCDWSLNDKIFKATVIDLLKCTNDTNVQWNYIGDGFGDAELAGLGIPPIALSDGTSPGAETLFKCCLHEVKALFESQLHLKIQMQLRQQQLDYRLKFWMILDASLIVSWQDVTLWIKQCLALLQRVV